MDVFWEYYDGGEKRGPPLQRKPLDRSRMKQIVTNKLLQELITVELADEAASIIVIRDISGILREDETNDLIDGVVALLGEASIDLSENLLHLFVAVNGDCEFNGVVKGFLIHNARLLSC